MSDDDPRHASALDSDRVDFLLSNLLAGERRPSGIGPVWAARRVREGEPDPESTYKECPLSMTVYTTDA